MCGCCCVCVLRAGARCVCKGSTQAAERAAREAEGMSLWPWLDGVVHDQNDVNQKKTSRRREGEEYGAHSESEGEENGLEEEEEEDGRLGAPHGRT